MKSLNSENQLSPLFLQFFEQRTLLTELYPEIDFISENFSDLFIHISKLEIEFFDVLKFFIEIIKVNTVLEEPIEFWVHSKVITLREEIQFLGIDGTYDRNCLRELLGFDQELSISMHGFNFVQTLP